MSTFLKFVLSLGATLFFVSSGNVWSDPLRRNTFQAGPYVPGEMLVKWKMDPAEGVVSAFGMTRSVSRKGVRRLALPAGVAVEDAVRGAVKDSSVEWAQPNYRFHALQCAPPADPHYTSLYQDWALTQIHAVDGWAQFAACPPGSGAVTVAIVDTGVWSGHPDLAGQVAPGWNVLDQNTNAQDDEGHGTFLAGLVAAIWNGAGMAGVAGGTMILPIKVLDAVGEGTSEGIIQGIEEATARGAQVINLSLGGGGFGPGDREAIDTARAQGIVVVAAAGNDGTDVFYPAAYPPAVAVGATDSAGVLSWYSNHGPNLDLVAPGGSATSSGFNPFAEMFSTACACASVLYYPRLASSGPGTLYATGAGTSFAAPLVSAAAALIRAKFPTLSAAQIEDRLISTTDDLGKTGWDTTYGYGSLNLERALASPYDSSRFYNFKKTFNSPNPFYVGEDLATNITLVMDNAQDVDLTIYDSIGETVWKRHVTGAELTTGTVNPQFKSFYISWDGRNGRGNWVVTGVYPYKVESDDWTGRGKIAVIRGHR